MIPTVALFLGDPTGIGPELAAKLMHESDIYVHAQIVVIGDARIFAQGCEIAGLKLPAHVALGPHEFEFVVGRPVVWDDPSLSPDEVQLGQLSAKAGKAVIDTLAFALQMTQNGVFDALVYAPLNKEAMHMGGSPFEDELHFFAHHLGWEGHFCELNVLGDLWTSRVTSHIGLADVAAAITADRVYEAIDLVDRTLRRSGRNAPRIAVSALNPHGGEGGLFGAEEVNKIEPGIKRAQDRGIDAHGPFPADTIFLRAQGGGFDAVVSMYHDQGQIALKLMGFERGVTVAGGLPIPITTPAHGTAFDIAGQGKANPQALREAVLLAVRMAQHWADADCQGVSAV